MIEQLIRHIHVAASSSTHERIDFNKPKDIFIPVRSWDEFSALSETKERDGNTYHKLKELMRIEHNGKPLYFVMYIRK